LKGAAHGVRSCEFSWGFVGDDGDLGGRQLSKETSLSSGSLKLWRADVEMDGLPSSET
jgi:hypothetical protein